ncbi:PREDICTED: protein LYK5-like [Fragaria vesca subsp. vesca]|uniref:protein LYK5-like n=1 Tax=Fragaria vesca subsp. vesca TaxID=101020 RepID=UPI0002C32E48|nr:PREDICTED: protein LYK5-like [Fragaria vesca subsp. vesca]
MKMKMMLLMVVSVVQVAVVHGQQSYLGNKQMDCDSDYNVTDGYVCNGAAPSCASYLTFRSINHYNTPASISRLLGSTPSDIATANNISQVDPIPTDTSLLVPVNCSCSGPYSQHNVSYTLKPDDTYFVIANDTYQGLTTCQALMHQNRYDALNLTGGLVIEVPIRCACPTTEQVDAGIKYLLAYLMDLDDDLDKIAILFGVDVPTLLAANNFKTSDDVVYPYQAILVPLTTKPSPLQLQFPVSPPSPPSSSSPPPTPPSSSPPPPSPPNKSSNKKWVFIGVGIGAGCLLLLITPFAFILLKRQHRQQRQTPNPIPKSSSDHSPDSLLPSTTSDEVTTWWSPFSSNGLKNAVESLIAYKFEDLQKSTDFFSEANRIDGSSVFRATFDGGVVAVKVMTGDLSLSGDEINILKRINHSSIISLSGFCVHKGNTYLVYEFAASGSLINCLEMKGNISPLSWKQRVQIANDVANALNYLHNFTHPPLIHKNLNTSNILLDANLRAKVANFGLARAVKFDNEGQDGGHGFQQTRHVVGTRGYMAPEYMEDGVITPKMDVFTFGVVLLELLSGKPASGDEEYMLLYASISGVLEGDDVRDKIKGFMDPSLRLQYPLELAFSMAHLAKSCVALQINSRPTMAQASGTLSKILSSTLDWDSSEAVDLEYSRSLNHGR